MFSDVEIHIMLWVFLLGLIALLVQSIRELMGD